MEKQKNENFVSLHLVNATSILIIFKIFFKHCISHTLLKVSWNTKRRFVDLQFYLNNWNKTGLPIIIEIALMNFTETYCDALIATFFNIVSL